MKAGDHVSIAVTQQLGWCLDPLTNITNYQHYINIISDIYNQYIINYIS